ncbi:hypothetical protein KM043_007045 [Ampulex compressa]|nr:hypothetical protein KM043_007045 [Ampulex compressa]
MPTPIILDLRQLARYIYVARRSFSQIPREDVLVADKEEVIADENITFFASCLGEEGPKEIPVARKTFLSRLLFRYVTPRCHPESTADYLAEIKDLAGKPKTFFRIPERRRLA